MAYVQNARVRIASVVAAVAITAALLPLFTWQVG